MGQADKSVLIAQTDTSETLEIQNSIDRQGAIDPAMCAMDAL